MKVDRKKLEKNLNKVINKISEEDRGIKENIVKYFDNKNYKIGVVNDILSLRIHLSTITNLDLGLFTTAIYKATNNKGINPEDFFTELEIRNIEGYKIIPKEEIPDFPLVINKAIQVNVDQWLCVMSIQEIVDWFNRKIPRYNSETQRPLKTKKNKNGGIVEEIDTDENAVNEMEYLMLKNKYISSTITFNVLMNGEEEINFNEKTGELIINKGEINITDGFHRDLAMIYASIKNKELDLRMEVRITNFDVAKSNLFIFQEDNKNHINKEYKKRMDVENLSSNIVRKLNIDSDFHLNGEITEKEVLIKTNKKKINSSIMIDSIQNTFNPKEKIDFIKDYNIIKERLNYIIEQKLELLENAIENQFVWAIYICVIYLSTKEENLINNDWKEYIKNNIDNYDSIKDIKKLSSKKISAILNNLKNNQ